MYDNNYLMHYGIKGMKWGVRRTPEQLGRKRQRAEKRKSTMSRIRNYTGSHSSDALKRSRKKDINKMSNRDLQNDINRLRLEREYRSLTKVDTSFGKNYMQDFNKHYSTATLTSKNASKAVGYGKQAVKAMKRTAKATAMA